MQTPRYHLCCSGAAYLLSGTTLDPISVVSRPSLRARRSRFRRAAPGRLPTRSRHRISPSRLSIALQPQYYSPSQRSNEYPRRTYHAITKSVNSALASKGLAAAVDALSRFLHLTNAGLECAQRHFFSQRNLEIKSKPNHDALSGHFPFE